MKIQYKLNSLYDRDETLQVAGIFFKTILKALRVSKSKLKDLKPTDLVFFPLSPYKIGRSKKLLLFGSKKVDGVIKYIDETFIEELTKEGLKVQREEVR